MAHNITENTAPDRTIFVKNIPPGTTKEELTAHFKGGSNGGGEVAEVIFKGKDYQWAYVIFQQAEALQTVFLHKHYIKGTQLTVQPRFMKVIHIVSAFVTSYFVRTLTDDGKLRKYLEEECRVKVIIHQADEHLYHMGEDLTGSDSQGSFVEIRGEWKAVVKARKYLSGIQTTFVALSTGLEKSDVDCQDLDGYVIVSSNGTVAPVTEPSTKHETQNDSSSEENSTATSFSINTEETKSSREQKSNQHMQGRDEDPNDRWDIVGDGKPKKNQQHQEDIPITDGNAEVKVSPSSCRVVICHDKRENGKEKHQAYSGTQTYCLLSGSTVTGSTKFSVEDESAEKKDNRYSPTSMPENGEINQTGSAVINTIQNEEQDKPLGDVSDVGSIRKEPCSINGQNQQESTRGIVTKEQDHRIPCTRDQDYKDTQLPDSVNYRDKTMQTIGIESTPVSVGSETVGYTAQFLHENKDQDTDIQVGQHIPIDVTESVESTQLSQEEQERALQLQHASNFQTENVTERRKIDMTVDLPRLEAISEEFTSNQGTAVVSTENIVYLDGKHQTTGSSMLPDHQESEVGSIHNYVAREIQDTKRRYSSDQQMEENTVKTPLEDKIPFVHSLRDKEDVWSGHKKDTSEVRKMEIVQGETPQACSNIYPRAANSTLADTSSNQKGNIDSMESADGTANDKKATSGEPTGAFVQNNLAHKGQLHHASTVREENQNGEVELNAKVHANSPSKVSIHAHIRDQKMEDVSHRSECKDPEYVNDSNQPHMLATSAAKALNPAAQNNQQDGTEGQETGTSPSEDDLCSMMSDMKLIDVKSISVMSGPSVKHDPSPEHNSYPKNNRATKPSEECVSKKSKSVTVPQITGALVENLTTNPDLAVSLQEQKALNIHSGSKGNPSEPKLTADNRANAVQKFPRVGAPTLYQKTIEKVNSSRVAETDILEQKGMSGVSKPTTETKVDYEDTLIIDNDDVLEYIYAKHWGDIRTLDNLAYWSEKKVSDTKRIITFTAGNQSNLDEAKEAFITLYQKVFYEVECHVIEHELTGYPQAICVHFMKKHSDTLITGRGSNRIHVVAPKACAAERKLGLMRTLGIEVKKTGQRRRRGNSQCEMKKKSEGETPVPHSNDSKCYLEIKKIGDNFFSFSINECVTVYIFQSDITCVNVDAIVNAANEHLQHGSGIARAIADKAGEAFARECQVALKRQGPLYTGKAVYTSAGCGSLKCKYVIHAVGPRWTDFVNKDECTTTLHNTVVTCLELAEKLELKSVAIPPISSGVFGVPKTVCAMTLYRAILEYCTSTYRRQLSKILLVGKDWKTTEIMLEVFKAEVRHHTYSAATGMKPSRPQTSKVSCGSDQNEMALSQSKTSARSIASGGAKPKWKPFEPPVNTEKTTAHMQNPEFDYNMSTANQAAIGQNTDPEAPTMCPICLDTISNPHTLPKCKHVFCKECINACFEKSKPVCPTCGTVYGKIIGTQPDGRMEVTTTKYSHLPGYERDGMITITYTFPSGRQGNDHPSPGSPYTGITRGGYLPDNKKGQKVLRLLRKAFNQRLTFTIGRSTTTGREGVITWNDIHHKTNISGGPQRFGYPDAGYLDRVLDELAAKGISE